MKDSIFVIWAGIIMTLLVGVFAIGIYEQRNKERLDVERTFIDAAKRYIEVHELEIETSIKVAYDDLKKEDYVDEVKYQDRSCKADVIVEKKLLFFKTYKPSVICE